MTKNQNRNSIKSYIECNASDVKCVNYDYLEKCYRRFCKKSNIKHIKLVTCNSLMS